MYRHLSSSPSRALRSILRSRRQSPATNPAGVPRRQHSAIAAVSGPANGHFDPWQGRQPLSRALAPMDSAFHTWRPFGTDPSSSVGGAGDDNDGSDNSSIPPPGGGGGDGPPVPATQTVPDHWPVVPVLAVNRHPVFPKFIKIVEVSDEKLAAVLRRKVRLNQPYVGVFVKRDDENADEVAASPEDVYPVGTFAQIVEMHDLGPRLRMVVMGHRRIAFGRQVRDTETNASGEEVKGGGGGEEEKAAAEAKEQQQQQHPNLTPKPDIAGDDRLIMAETENVPKEEFQHTDEMKALTQEVIKTIRDIIVSCLLFPWHTIFPYKLAKF